MGTDVDGPARARVARVRRPWSPVAVATAVAAALLLGPTAAPAHAQTQAQAQAQAQVQAQTPDVEQSLRVNRADLSAFPAVNLTITPPRDRSGSALDAAQLTLTELGRRRAVELVPLQAEELSVAIVLDVSVDGDALQQVKGAAIELILRLPDGAKTLLLAGDGSPIGRAEATSDRQANLDELRTLQAGIGAPLTEGILPALERLVPDGADRPTVVLISPAAVEVSDQAAAEAASQALAQARAGLYIITGHGGPTDEPIAALAAATGGRALFTEGPGQDALISAVDRLLAELTSQYRVSFSSAAIRPVPVTLALGAVADTATTPVSMTVDLAQPVPAPSPSSTPSSVPGPGASSVPDGSKATPVTAADDGSNGVVIGVVVAVAVALLGAALLFLARRRRTPSTAAAPPDAAPPDTWDERPPVMRSPAGHPEPVGSSVPGEPARPRPTPASPSSTAAPVKAATPPPPPARVPARPPAGSDAGAGAAAVADAALRHLSARMASLPAGLPLDGLVRREATASCAVDRTAVALWQVLRMRAHGDGGGGSAKVTDREVALVEATAMASLTAAAGLARTGADGGRGGSGLDDEVLARAATALGSPISLHAVEWPGIDGSAEPSRRAAHVHDAVYRAGHGSPNRGILARLAMGLSIVDSGLAAGVAVDSSAHVLAHRARYLELVGSPDRAPLIDLMLEALAVRSEQTMVVVDRLVELRDQFRVVVEADGVPHGAALVDWVVANPIFGDTFVADTLHVDAAAAAELLAWLDQSGMVRRIEVTGLGEVYRVAPAVLGLLDEKLHESLQAGASRG